MKLGRARESGVRTLRLTEVGSTEIDHWFLYLLSFSLENEDGNVIAHYCEDLANFHATRHLRPSVVDDVWQTVELSRSAPVFHFGSSFLAGFETMTHNLTANSQSPLDLRGYVSRDPYISSQYHTPSA